MSEPVTIIGANTVISGNLEGDEDLTIEGRVEGTITLSRTLTIENNGVVHANINVRNAVISGVLVGNIEAQDSVHITEEGRVMGDISAPRVILVDGASFRGSIDMGDFDIERGDRSTGAAEEKAVRIAAAPAVKKAPISAKPVSAKPVSAKPIERPPQRVRTPSIKPPAPKSEPPAAKEPAVAKEPVAAKEAMAPKELSVNPATPINPQMRKAPEPKMRIVGKAKAAKKKRA